MSHFGQLVNELEPALLEAWSGENGLPEYSLYNVANLITDYGRSDLVECKVTNVSFDCRNQF